MTDLHPDAARVLEASAGAPPLSSLTPEQARAGHLAGSPGLSGESEPVAAVEDVVVAGVPCRRFVPAGASAGTVVYVHGGGWVVGTMDTYASVCSALANAAGRPVLSVDYDLAPEKRYPHQLDQVVAVLRAVGAEAAGPVSLAGDSAGGQLALLAASAVRGQVDLTAVGLVYPCTDPALDSGSARANATGKMLETEGMRWYWEHYLGEAGAAALPHDAGPGIPPVDGMPPTLLVLAGHDPLHDDGIAVAEALRSAGVPVEVEEHADQIHGFVRMTAINADAVPSLRRLGAFLVAPA